MNKTLWLLILVLGIFLTACSSSSGSTAGENDEQFTFKLGHVGPADAEHPWEKYARTFAEEVERESDGRIKIETYPASQLGADREMTEALQQGTLEMGLISTIAMGNFVPELQIWDLPYIFPTDNAKVDEILDGSIGDKMKDAVSQKQMIALSFWENDWRAMSNSKGPIESVEDLKGVKIRVVENKPSLHWFERVGAIPTPMAFSEVYTALQQRTIDAQDNGTLLTFGSKFYEVQPYFTFTNHIYAPLAVMISESIWNKIPDDLKTILEETAERLASEQRQYSRDTAKQLGEEMKAAGVEVTELSDEAIKSFQESAEETYDALAPELGQDLINEMLQYRD
ncbi:TRAP transporter substrate-binding protein [Robertmurraya sp. DFI.2.37]|jgi:tripartite ATP-independent transporter DctP family solute receptor|uniref:TRAP transporter substrate-binding protein n=1 Tax=Robertmurraya sp. DFI.2.37 TaxID=3031819 RepID=UPI0012442959|nr:TRAP transporter substrate-binding protein [Robertmurraya sp. DFI.2.37]MDF1506777.1 TRAP transporter substrate-binding protein [Robertmurraya sp. DFI.2.37]